MSFLMTATCKFLVILLLQVHLQNCVVVEEYMNATLTCNAKGLVEYSQLTWYQDKMPACSCYWAEQIAYCTCETPRYTSNITDGLSYLNIRNVSINDSGLWRCEVSPTYTETSNLVVVARASGVKCFFSVDLRQLELTCTTEKIFPTAICTFAKNTPFYLYPITYNHTRDSQGYYKSTCNVKAPLNRLTPGLFNISAEMFPSGSSTQYTVSTLNYIELTYPEPMLLNCPSVDKNANNSFIKFGTNATCTCTTKPTGNPAVKAYWNGSMSDITSDVLVIDTFRKNATYTCTVLNVFSTLVQNKSVTYTPRIAYPAEILSFTANNNPTSLMIIENTSVSFTCEVDSNPQANVIVYKQENGRVLPNTTTIVSCEDSGSYVCQASNFVYTSPQQRSISLYVRCSLHLRSTNKREFSAKQSSDFITKFDVYGYPAPVSYDLFKKENGRANNVYNSTSGNKKYVFYYIVKNLPYGSIYVTLYNITVIDFTTYTLSVYNGFGKETNINFMIREEKDKDVDNTAVAALGGVIAVILVIAVVVIVFIKRKSLERRLKCCSKRYEAKAKTENSRMSHTIGDPGYVDVDIETNNRPEINSRVLVTDVRRFAVNYDHIDVTQASDAPHKYESVSIT